jgi:two-component system, chemotaxis family, response regulator Rcp1
MPNRALGTIKILIVEDNPGDARLIREAFNEGKILNTSYVVKDGVEAMDFLHKHEEFSNAPRPDLILLDLNLPKKDGREVLFEIKNDKKLKNIPVIILTTSQAEEDITKSYDLHANCYIIKPLDFGQFIKMIQSLEEFWFSIVKLPPVN